MKKYIYLILFTLITILTFGESGLGFEEIQFKEIEQSYENKELKIIQAGKVTTIDPILMKDQYSIRTTQYIYDTLFVYNEKGEVEKNLIESWSWKNERILRLKIRKGIYFHNGDKLVANDIKKSLERVVEKGIFKEFFNDLQNIKVINEEELEIKLIKQNKQFIPMLTYYMCSITKEENGMIYGTGPYQLKKITNKELDLEKNFRYFKSYTGPLKIKFISEISDRKRSLAYFNDDANIVLDVNIEQIEGWKKEGIISESALIKEQGELETIAITFGNKNEIFNKKENRELIKNLVERKNLLKNVTNQEAATTFFPKQLFDAKLSVIKKSKMISEKNSLKNYLEVVVLNNETSIKIANNLKNELYKNGIELKVELYQQDAYFVKMENKDYEIAISNIGFDKKYLVYNLGKVIAYEIGDKDMYNAILPFLEILKKEKEKEDVDKIYDKIVYLISKNTPYIPIVHRNKVSIENTVSFN